jgi:PIF1-like helicase
LPDTSTTLFSDDSIVDDDPDNPLMDPHGAAPARKQTVTPEELHMETPSGMPDHELELKPKAIAILIRNLDVSAGLVNGLRLRIKSVSRLLVRAEAISGGPQIKGKIVDLARIDFEGDVDSTLRMRRTQFPLKLAFCMTINKSQGLTLRKVSFHM